MKTFKLSLPPTGSLMMIGAGLCAAVFFAVARQATWQAFVFANLITLPLMISTLGFGPVVGLGSLLISAIVVGLLGILHAGGFTGAGLDTGLTTLGLFLAIDALPAWWLCVLARLVRPEGASRWQLQSGEQRSPQPLRLYPIGQIVVHAALIAAVLASLGIGALAVTYGSPSVALDQLTPQFLPAIEAMVSTHPEISRYGSRRLTEFTLELLPALAAAWIMMMYLINLWLAAGVVFISNKLPRPWPRIAHELRVPRLLILVLIGSLALCLTKGWLAEIGLTVAVIFCLVYALQGLAVAHDLSRGSRWNRPALVLVYMILILFIPCSLVLFALVAFADTFFSLRDRKAPLPSSKI